MTLIRAIHLRTEYLKNPLPIDVTEPRFFWHCEGGNAQSAYQIVAEKDSSIVWDSGKVVSNQMTHILYGGNQLKSRDCVTWKVRLWDENGKAGELSEAKFEIGLLEKSDWTAKWITGNYTPKKHMRYPVDCFQKQFAAKSKIHRARFYITALGLYEARLNDKRIGDFCLAPGCTDYRRRLQYQAYDVTALLKEKNTLEIQLADGWYRGSIGCFGATNVFGRQTKLLCQMEITYEDGTTECINSDSSFLWSNDGAIRFADLKDGEIYDANKTPTYSDKAKVVTETIMVTPTASNNVDVKRQETFNATLITSPSGKKILDFGQNIAGFIDFTIKGTQGQKIKLRCGEILDEKGELTLANIQLQKPAKEFGKVKQLLLITGQIGKINGELVPTPIQEVEFVCSGGEDHYQMTFSVFGFRYAEIETDVRFDASQFKAIAVYSDMERVGNFTCSNENVNQFVENTIWSMKGNFLDIPTDCPTRERLGWTGDGQIFFNTASFFMDVAAFYKKWMKDIEDGQFSNGKSSAVVPYAGVDMVYKSTGGSVGWNDAVVLIPYRYWKRYGDAGIIREFYGVMRKYAMFMIKNTGAKSKASIAGNPFSKYVYESGIHLGEWLEPEEFRDTLKPSDPKPEECTAYLHYTMTCMAEIANVLGKSKDKSLFREYADGAKKAYDSMFVKQCVIDTDRQAKLVRPLALGLLDGDTKKRVQERLIKAVENRNYKIGTGFLSTPFTLPVLTDAVREDVAYKMLENEEAPSWLAEVKAGATTVWENWDGKDSRNHYSPGAMCEWLFNTVGGINIAGENYFEIKPVPGGTLTFAKTEFTSIYGTVRSSWNKTQNGYLLEAEIPVNTKARIILKNGTSYEVTSGTYTYEF